MHHVDCQLKTEQQAKATSQDYTIADKLLVLISSRRDHEYLIRIGRRVAEKRQVPWIVVWVDTGAMAISGTATAAAGGFCFSA